jgi:hypothetical protein
VSAPVTPMRRRERATLWQDSTFFQDSFFAPDVRGDNSLTGELPPYDPSRIERAAPSLLDVELPGREPERLDDAVDTDPGEGQQRYPGTGTHN